MLRLVVVVVVLVLPLVHSTLVIFCNYIIFLSIIFCNYILGNHTTGWWILSIYYILSISIYY